METHAMRAEVEVQSVKIDLGNGTTVEMELGDKPSSNHRHCASCSLCCRLLPVREVDKPANTKCRHQRGRQPCCAVYGQEFAFPNSCATWTCRWLVDPDFHLPRPDRAHYVVDVFPDTIVCQEGDRMVRVPVVQVWVDPQYPDAHRDPRLRAWLAEQGKQYGMAAIIRDSWV